MILKSTLEKLYVQEGLSASVIARRLNCSQHKINYWLTKHRIQKRTISDALYRKWNPRGDPFFVRRAETIQEGILYGLGIGLYWGEGTKANKNSIKLGNTDPELVRMFMKFLVTFYAVDKKRLRFGLQIFGDMNIETSIRYWVHSLKVSRRQFYPKIIVTPHRGIGNYRHKTEHGVLTVYFNNTRLRDIVCNAIKEVAK